MPKDVPDALGDSVAQDEQKRKQWDSFVSLVLSDPVALEVVIRDLREFLMPHALSAQRLSKRLIPAYRPHNNQPSEILTSIRNIVTYWHPGTVQSISRMRHCSKAVSSWFNFSPE